MKRDDCKPALRLENELGRVQPGFKFAQFVNNIEPQTLECARRRMDRLARGRGPQRARDGLCKFARARDRPGGNDRARDATRKAFLAQRADDLDQGRFVGRVDKVGGRSAVASHAHIERTVEAKRKPTFRLIELE